MQIEHIDITTLRDDPRNVRRHDRRNIEAIKASLQQFGQQKPIVVGEENVVIAGNGTLAAARELGWTQIDIVRTALAGPEATAYAIADNRTAELAAWDDDLLRDTLAALKSESDELFAVAGFHDAEFERMLDDLTGQSAPPVPEIYQIVVQCKDEAEQREVYELLRRNGSNCRVNTL